MLFRSVAQAYAKQGGKVRRLGLIDTVLPDPVVSALVRAEPEMLDEVFERDARAMAAHEGLAFGSEERAGGAGKFRALAALIEGFRVDAFDIPLTLVVSEETSRREPRRAWADWSLLAMGGMTTLLVPGDHYSVLQGTAVKRIARRLAWPGGPALLAGRAGGS